MAKIKNDGALVLRHDLDRTQYVKEHDYDGNCQYADAFHFSLLAGCGAH